jgi:hypothetical protein
MPAAWNRVDLVGQRFGCLTVMGIESTISGRLLWSCRCDCGGSTVTTGAKLTSGHSKSCGCSRRRTGDDHPNTDTRPILERLAERSVTNLTTGCCEWQGSHNKFGHGTIRIKARLRLVHRSAWEAVNGPIPRGLGCLHECDNPPCWNTDHLFLGTRADNNADRDRKGRQVAPKGSAHGCAVLSEDDVRAIRAIPDYRGAATAAAKRFGISISTADRIRKRQSWEHLL